MFNKSGPCRLCLKLLKCDQTLYDEYGRRTNAYELVAKYITPELLDMECAKHLQSICMKCWRFINEFHTFQQCVLLNQRKLAGFSAQVEFPTNFGHGVLLKTTGISPATASQVAVEAPGEIKIDARYDSNSSVAEQHCSNIPAGGFDGAENIIVDSTAEILPSGGFVSSSLTDNRNNLEFFSGLIDGEVVKSEVVEELQLIELAKQPDTAIPFGGANSNIVLSSLSSNAISKVTQDKKAVAFGLGEHSIAEIPSNLLPAALAIGADETINSTASCDESSDESNHIYEECDEFDDPVGTFIGGEFGNSISETAQSPSEDCSTQPEGCEIDGYSSDEDMPLAQYLWSRKRPFNPEDREEKENQTTTTNLATSKSEQGTSQGNKKKRHKTAEEFDVSDSQDSDTDFSVGNENSPSKAKDNEEHNSKENNAIPQQPNPSETNQADKNQKTSNFNHTPKNSENKRRHKTALEFDDSEAESVASNEEATHSEDELYIDSQNKIKLQYRPQYKLSYLANIKRPQTTQEYDDFIAKWRPNLECVICKETCSKFSLLLQHFKDQHPTEECYIWCCQLKFYKRCEIEKHIYYHSAPGAFKCEVCCKCYTTANALRKHLMDKHTGKPPNFKCPQCSSTFIDGKKLKRHLKRSCDKDEKKKERIYGCSECDKSYKLIKVLKRHYKYEHIGKERKIIKCSICDQICQTQPQLREHMDKHRGERNNVCPCCPQSFFFHKTLMLHLKNTHPKKFQEMRKEQEELRKVKKTYTCADCGNVYQTLLAYQEHQASHKGKAIYRCKLCPKEYKYSSNLAAHVKRVHPKYAQERKSRPMGSVDLSFLRCTVKK